MARTVIDDAPSRRIGEIEEHLRSTIIGQDRAIARVLPDFEIDEAGLIEPGMLATLKVFAGPPGVGKTELAYQLMYAWIGTLRRAFDGTAIDPLVKIDGPEFVDAHDIATLRGSTKGYVGYEDDTPLMQENLDRYHWEVLFRNAVSLAMKRAQSRRVAGGGIEKTITGAEANRIVSKIYDQMEHFKKGLLFDEIERAHRGLWNLLLSIMNVKPMTFTDGRVTDFTRTALLMTSNVGERRLQQLIRGGGLGFRSDWRALSPEEQDEEMYKVVREEIQKTFSPAFYSRIRKNIVIFRPLTEAHYGKILDLRLEEITSQFSIGHGDRPVLRIKVTDECKKFLLKKGVRPESGARPMRDVLRSQILGRLARAINKKAFRSEETVIFDYEAKPKPRVVMYTD